jgi:hypothetical protein
MQGNKGNGSPLLVIRRALTPQLQVGGTGSYLCVKGGPSAPADMGHVMAVIGVLISGLPSQCHILANGQKRATQGRATQNWLELTSCLSNSELK